MSNLNEIKRRVVTNVENKPFWEAAGQGRLMVGFCNACGENHYYPRSICPICIVDCEAGTLRIGQRVRVHFVEAEDGCAIPMFSPL